MKGAGVAPPEFLIQSSSGKKDWKLAFLTIFLAVLTLLIQRAHIWKAVLFTHYLKFCLDLHTAIVYDNEARCGVSAHMLSIYWWHRGSYRFSFLIISLWLDSSSSSALNIHKNLQLGIVAYAVWCLNLLLSLTQSFSVTLPSPPFLTSHNHWSTFSLTSSALLKPM